MIRMLEGMPDGVLGLEAEGKLSAGDYTEVLEPALATATREHGKIRIVLVFSGAFDGMEAGAVWQDLRTGVRNWDDWERIALVTDHTWMRDGLRLFSWAVPGDVKAFATTERDEAITWAAAG